MVKVSANIVTFHSRPVLRDCLESLERQTFRDFETHLLDNASGDNSVQITADFPVDVVRSATNIGFCAAHNRLVRMFPSEYVLFLNPDTRLRPDFISELVRALDDNPRAASACGKLLRFDGVTIDSTGIIMLRSQRHLDRGAEERDSGQYETPEEIFGPSGAAAMYRVSALRQTAIDDQFFDEDFFAYREDADLAWRCRLAGWTSLYVPSAVALHGRRVTPERRGSLPALINYHSVKNRFLLRINNMSGAHFRRQFRPTVMRDLAVVGYVLLREHRSIPALAYIVRHWARLWAKRRRIQSMVRVSDNDLVKWFQ